MRRLLCAFVLSLGVTFTGSQFVASADEGVDDGKAPAAKTEDAGGQQAEKDKAKAKKDGKGKKAEAAAEKAPAVAPKAPAAEKQEAPQAQKAEPAANDLLDKEAAPVKEAAAKEEAPKVAAEAAPGKEAKAGEQVQEKKDEVVTGKKKKKCPILFYIPNLLKDLSEICSIQAGAGPEAGLRLTMTRWAQLGLEYGESYFLMKGYEGQCGGGSSNGWDAAAACLYGEKRSVDQTFGSVKPYLITDRSSLIPSRDEEIYKERIRDFWGCGVKVGWLIAFDFEFHPDEIADFFAGIFFYDLKEDNW